MDKSKTVQSKVTKSSHEDTQQFSAMEIQKLA